MEVLPMDEDYEVSDRDYYDTTVVVESEESAEER